MSSLKNKLLILNLSLFISVACLGSNSYAANTIGKRLADLFPTVNPAAAPILFAISNPPYSPGSCVCDLAGACTGGTGVCDPSVAANRYNQLYQAFYNCAKTPTNANCASVLTPAFFDISSSIPSLEDTYGQLNRCIVINENRHVLSLPMTFDIATGTVACNPTGQQIQVLHILACYGKTGASVGAYCNFATACFEGPQALGKCTKDYAGQDRIKIAF